MGARSLKYTWLYGAGVICSRLGACGPLFHAATPCAHAETGRWNAHIRPVSAPPLTSVPTRRERTVGAATWPCTAFQQVGGNGVTAGRRLRLIVADESPPGRLPPPPGGHEGRFYRTLHRCLRRGRPGRPNGVSGLPSPARPSGAPRRSPNARASTRRTGRPGSSGRHRRSTRAPPWPRPSPSPWRRRSATPSGPRSPS